MKKLKLFLVIAKITIITDCYSQYVYPIDIPDVNFKKYLLQSSINQNNDNEITNIEALKFVNLDISNKNIKSLEGIQEFSNLKYLDFSGNKVRHTDLSLNQKLQILVCDNNDLIYLEIKHNANLKYLSCSGNKLRLLKLPSSEYLRFLKLSNNRLRNLNIAELPELETIHISNNMLRFLDMSNNLKIKSVLCNNNEITNLDTSNNEELKYLSCANNKIEILDIRPNKNLNVLNCENNELKTLKIYFQGHGSNLNTLKTKSNRSLYEIHTNYPDGARIAVSRQIFQIDSHTKFVSYTNQRKFLETLIDASSSVMEVIFEISNNTLKYRSNDKTIDNLDIEVYNLSGQKVVTKTKLVNGELLNLDNTLISGPFICFFYTKNQIIRKLIKIENNKVNYHKIEFL
ncbi:leucine-rich repeat domain-containing protein [Tenacibaculum sp. C7A-26P2]|uniref:leucine-rich repeat domain-containing protein n=1 Tax=Tenacibaculum sp. C7A-26P2 TaxID=3447504 RepID=UPI003F872027